MFQFIRKYSPGYGQNTIEGWSIILVVAVGVKASTFADSWLGMVGMFIFGILCAHVIACMIKFFISNRL